MTPTVRRLPAVFLALALQVGLFVPPPAFAAALDPESEAFYRLARHFMTGSERKTFRRLSTAEVRKEFITAFWEIRDPDPTTRENEFRDEVEARFEFVNRYFNEPSRPGWNTDRGMVYLVLGPPNSVNQVSSLNDPSLSGVIRWFYGNIGFYVQFVDRQGYGIYELDMAYTPLQLMDYLETGKNRLLSGPEKGIAGRYLDFSVRGEPQQDRLLVDIALRKLTFESGDDGRQVARVQLGVNLYLPGGTITTRREERRLPIDDAVLQAGKLTLVIELPFARGRNQVDLLVVDQVGGKLNRRLFSFKKK